MESSNTTEVYEPKPRYADTADWYVPSPTSIMMTVMSTISAAASLSILAAFSTYLRNKSSSRGLLQIIVFIALSNALTSFGSIVGYPADRTLACWWEGIVTNIFTLSSVYWCLDVTIILYYIVVVGRARTIGWVDHVLCWGIPVLATCIPFINFTYGSPGGGWCFVVPYDDYVDSSSMSMLWFWVCYYVHIWLCVGVMALSFAQIWSKIKSQANLTQPLLKKIYRKLQWYPIVIVICWLPACISDTTNLVLGDYPGYSIVNGVSSFLSCSQGLLTGIIFWTTYDEAAKKVKNTLLRTRASFLGAKYEPPDNALSSNSEVDNSERSSLHNFSVSRSGDGDDSSSGGNGSVELKRGTKQRPTVMEYRTGPEVKESRSSLLSWIGFSSRHNPSTVIATAEPEEGSDLGEGDAEAGKGKETGTGTGTATVESIT